jgi:hypothetical protein
MKQCPVCQNTYTDDTLQFCLEDGAALSFASGEQPTQVIPPPNNPIRVNIAQDSSPTVVAEPKITTPEPVKKKGSGWNLIIGLIIGFVGSTIIAIGMFAAILWWQNKDKAEAPANSKPQNSNVNSVVSNSPNINSNPEKKTANQNIQKPTVPTISNTNLPSTKITARVNSPNDGFLALRTEPSSETGERILQIPHGTNVTVIACLPKAVGKKGRWCRVDYNGNIGWAFDGFLIY